MSVPRLSLSLGLAFAASLALAATPVGKWTGRISMKAPSIPANANPQQKAFVQQMVAQLAKARVLMTLKADKTFVMTVTGMPMAASQKPQMGKWSQKGNVVMLTSTAPAMAGRPKPKPSTQKATLSADGKTMTLVAPNDQGKVVFTR